MSGYPDTRPARDRWMLDRRPPHPPVRVNRAASAFVEEERLADGGIGLVATLLLTGHECPWRCLMCDLWRSTTTERTPQGALVSQIRSALRDLPAARAVKLYNSGSFFDRAAVPFDDLPEIAALVRGFSTVVVESHPALVGKDVVLFRDLLGSAALEVAVGLETAHPDVLEKLNKGMTLDDFARASDFLRDNDVPLRAFLLVGLPFLERADSREWVRRGIAHAFDRGVSVVSLVPTRAGNGALDELLRQGAFAPPALDDLEDASDFGVALSRGRVFADLWDLERLAGCAECFPARRERLHAVNLSQQVLPRITCAACGG